MATHAQTYSTRSTAPVEVCFAVLTDFDAYPQWSSPIRSARVLERYPDGLARRVAFELDMTIRTVRYTLEYTWTPPHGGRWRMTEGDVASIEGAYEFTPSADGTLVTCRQAIEPGFWIPGFLRTTYERRALRDSVEEFCRAAEARARA